VRNKKLYILRQLQRCLSLQIILESCLCSVRIKINPSYFTNCCSLFLISDKFYCCRDTKDFMGIPGRNRKPSSVDAYPSFFPFNTHRPACMILLHASPQGIPTPKMLHKQHISQYVTCLPISSPLRM
jgi:hypothetical protein